TAASGRSYVLKAMHPARERSLVAMQCAALVHLEARAPQLPLPRVVQTRRGDAGIEGEGPGGHKRLVFVLSWLPGEALAGARPRSPETLVALGRLLGEMDRALADFAHEASRRELDWDLSRALALEPELERVLDPARRALAA